MSSLNKLNPVSLNLVFSEFKALNICSNDLGDVLMYQGDQFITFPAALAAMVREALTLAEQGET